MGRDADAGDVWRDLPGGVGRDSGDGSYAAIGGGRPEHLTPLDPSGLVSGHDPAAADHRPPPIADAPEHDWKHARDLIYPAFRPVGTQGLSVLSLDREALATHGRQRHAEPLLDEGPAGLPVFYTIDAGAFDIIVNGDHLLSWAVDPSDVQDAAMRNLGRLVGRGAVDRRGLRRAPADQLGHGERVGRGADPPAGGHGPPR